MGGNWGRKGTRKIKSWTIGKVTTADPGSASGNPHLEREKTTISNSFHPSITNCSNSLIDRPDTKDGRR